MHMHMHMCMCMCLALPDRDERDESEPPAADGLQPGPAVRLDEGDEHPLDAVDLSVCIGVMYDKIKVIVRTCSFVIATSVSFAIA